MKTIKTILPLTRILLASYLLFSWQVLKKPENLARRGFVPAVALSFSRGFNPRGYEIGFSATRQGV